MITTVLPSAERKGKRIKDCQSLAELEQWLGSRWKLLDPDTAVEDIRKPGGYIRVEMQK